MGTFIVGTKNQDHSKKCVAVKPQECLFQDEIKLIHRRQNNVLKLIQINTEEHRNIRADLKSVKENQNATMLYLNSISTIKLNGDDTATPTKDIIRDIYNITKEQRGKYEREKLFENWKKNTVAGRFIKTGLGKITMFIMVAWILTTSLNAFGLKGVNPVEVVWTILKAWLRIQ